MTLKLSAYMYYMLHTRYDNGVTHKQEEEVTHNVDSTCCSVINAS